MSAFSDHDVKDIIKLLETAFDRITALEAEAANARTVRPTRGALLLSENVLRTIARRLIATEERLRRLEDELLGEVCARDRRKEIYDKGREMAL